MKHRVVLQALDPWARSVAVNGSVHHMEHLPSRGDFVYHAEHGTFEVLKVIYDLPSTGSEPWRTPEPSITLVVQ